MLDIRNTENVCPSLDLRSCVLPWRLFTRLAMLPTTTPRAAGGGGPPTVGRPSYSPKEAPNPTNQPNRPAPEVPDASSFHLLLYIGGVVASTLIWNLDLHFMRTPSPLQAPAARPYKRASKAPKPRQTSLGSLLFHKLPPPAHQIFSHLIHHELCLVQTSTSNPRI